MWLCLGDGRRLPLVCSVLVPGQEKLNDRTKMEKTESPPGFGAASSESPQVELDSSGIKQSQVGRRPLATP